jgi:hypothetical protein
MNIQYIVVLEMEIVSVFLVRFCLTVKKHKISLFDQMSQSLRMLTFHHKGSQRFSHPLQIFLCFFIFYLQN